MPTLFIVSAAFTAGAITTVTAPKYLSAQAETTASVTTASVATAPVTTETSSKALVTSANAAAASAAASPCQQAAWPYNATNCGTGAAQAGRQVRVISITRDDVRQASNAPALPIQAPVLPQLSSPRR
jgi:hypothetical protein